MKKYFLLMGILLFLCIFNINCQFNSNQYQEAKELIKIKNQKVQKLLNSIRFQVCGVSAGNYVLFITDSLQNRKLMLYDETTEIIKADTVKLNLGKSKPLEINVFNNVLMLRGYFELPDIYQNVPIDKVPSQLFDYQDLWIQYKNNKFRIDSFPYYFLDKYIGCRFSSEGRYLVCNPYSTNSAGYLEGDNGIYVYDLKKIDKGIVEKQKINCDRCFQSFIISDTVYFGKEQIIGGGVDGVFYNIYKAPLRNINDTVLIASNIEIELITPDGKYIFGSKYLYGKYASVIVDVSTKRYQYMLGRDYSSDYMFYSKLEKKFVFDFGVRLVYLAMPEIFPFDATDRITYEKYIRRGTSKEQNEAFWKKFRYDPFNK